MHDTPYDLVVFGATSFVGQLLCRYLNERYASSDTLRWAAAGRSEAKLNRLSDDLGTPQLPLILADAGDAASLHTLCGQTRAVISTVGPYALYGEPLIKVCAETGTDYCDLTGEVLWIQRMIEAYESAAQQSGARIVNCCGFDSLPSDLGVHFLQEAARERFGKPCKRIRMRVKAMRGGFSGGTVASMFNMAREIRAKPHLRKEMANPYAICPPGYRMDVRQPSVKTPEYDRVAGSWIAPFIMAGTNTRVVQRSNALDEAAYGENFLYDEAVMTGEGAKGRARALALSAGLGSFMVGAAMKPSRWILERFVLPKPGQGPSPEAQANGFYNIRFFGETDSGQTLRAKVTGDRDPGYGSTSKMLGEAGACLALDLASDDKPGGFWTPATLLGDRLIERLQENAGVQFTLLD